VGPQGERGGKGDRGAQGPIGASGPATVLSIGTVVTGPIASAALTGVAPSQTLSLVLPRGEQGAVGPQGPIGPQGPQGDAAGVVIKGKATQWPPDANPDIGDIYIIPTPAPIWVPAGYVSGDAALWDGADWDNAGPIQGPRGEKGERGDQGIPGTNGSIGPSGPAGPPNNLTIGSVTEAAVGSQPEVIITGNSPAQTLNFLLPAAKPNTLTVGTVTQGFTAYAEIVGTAPNQILNLILPNPAIFNSTSFNVNPRDVSVIDGEPATFTASANSTEFPIVYSWQSSTDGNTWADIDGTGSETLTFTADTAQNNRLYRCSAATPSVGRVYSQIAKLKVAALPGLGNGAQRLKWGFRNDITVLGSYDYFIGTDLWKSNGRLFTRGHTSTNGINWTKTIGGPDANPGGLAVNSVRYAESAWVMAEETDGSNFGAASRVRFSSSDGVNWQFLTGNEVVPGGGDAINVEWGRLGKAARVSGQLTWAYQHGMTEQGNNFFYSANTKDGILATKVGNRTLYYVASDTSNDISCCVERNYQVGGGIFNTSDLGGIQSISDTLRGVATGIVGGQSMHVAMGATKWWLVPEGQAVQGTAATSIARPSGFDMHPPAFANGWWLGTHVSEPGVYFTSRDLVFWYTHIAQLPGTDLTQYRLGRAYEMNGRFVIGVKTLGGQLEGVLYSD
jgi:hypothetical protein